MEQTGEKSYVLCPVKEINIAGQTDSRVTELGIANPYDAQELKFALRTSGPVNGCLITLPAGDRIKSERKMEANQFVICNGSQVYVADRNRNKIAGLVITHTASVPGGQSKMGVQFPEAGPMKVPFYLTVWVTGKEQTIGK